MIPETIGAYRLEARIGQGGMGEVFRAFDARLNRSVAVKVMRHTPGNEAPAVERFLREARAASALNHPNIVTIHEVGETPEGDSFIVQEFIEGRTLRALLDAPLPLATIADIGGQVARALAAAHAAGIVHRDIKPENVMIRRDGYVKVLDFGLARVIDVGASDVSTRSEQTTKAGTLLGTTAYMSPEQACAVAAGPPADIFALGIVLYEMTAGRRPFAAPTTVGVLAAIVSEEPVPLARAARSIPRGFGALVERMLAKAPEWRPSAREVVDELAALGASDALGSPSPPAAVTSRRTVGREAQRDALRRAYEGMKSGRSLLMAISGEPGIGKTTLAEDFIAELSKDVDRPIVTRGRCSERLAGAEAYLPILEVLDDLLHLGNEAVRSTMKAVAPTWYAQVASPSPASLAAPSGEQAPAGSQERMKRELAALIGEISKWRPLVVYLDDLHWADVSTIDILNYLAARFADMRVLVLTTYRPADMALAAHPFLGISHDLRSRGVFEEMALGFLGPADVERYLAQEFPKHGFPSEFPGMIHGKTEGSPLFMADLVRYLRGSGTITEENGAWRLARSVSNAPDDLPESVRSLIARKIAQLDEQDRRLLVAASVQGHEFDSRIVAEALERDPADVEDRLDVLERVHVFVKRDVEYEFPDLAITLKYRFVHVLYQNVLYASLTPTRRATLSGRVARALAAHSRPEAGSIAGRLAVLFEVARDFAASAQHFFAATQHANGLFAFREALSLAERGLAVLRGLPDGPARMQQELGLQMLKGGALRSTSGWATLELERTFARARQLCQELGDPPQVFPVLWAITLFHLIRGNLVECRTRADELMVKAAESGTPAFLMAAHHMAGVSREFMGEMADSSRLLERARDLHDPAEHPAYTAMYGLDPGMIARAMSSRPLWVLGYPDRALERARETLAIARSQRQPLTLVFAFVVLHGILAYRGDAADALAIGEENIALCREHELPQEAEWSRSFQGSALITLGRTDEGIDLLKDSMAAQDALKTHLARPMFLALLAEGLCQAGRVDEGLRAVDEGMVWAERTEEHGYVAELHRMRGELLRLAGKPDAAEASLRVALDHARGQQAKSFELRAATGLAHLLRAAGRAKEARAALAPALAWFTEGRETADLRAAQATLSELG